MIDQDLIENNKKHLASCISNRLSTPIADLYQITDVLDLAILQKLNQYVSSVSIDKWQTVEGQETLPRQKITWDFDTVIEELHEIFDSATDLINETFTDPYKHFWGVSLWKDEAGYEIGWHTDNPDIDVAMQIYLYTSSGVGTIFGSEHTPILIPSEHNSGYLIQHDRTDKISHRSESVVSAGTTRYILYAVWSRISKHLTDT